MDWLNYHHLFYFWTVAREGSIARASEKLSLAQPTISTQIRTLEQSLGHELFSRRGRGLVLTATGRVVQSYADEIFANGRELMATVGQGATHRAARIKVGVTDAVPKLVARELLKPALCGDEPVHMVIREGKLESLVSELATHRLDLVLSDYRYRTTSTIRIFHHRLGECGVTFFAAPALAKRLAKGFPESLDGAPALLPTDNTALRGSLEDWFSARGVRPLVIAEFEDTALLKVFGSEGLGFIALPSIAVAEVMRSHAVEIIGEAPDCRESFFALTAERKLKHPAIRGITQAAREGLFAKPKTNKKA
jgi:LysR family transcriptional activator of nhaA